MTAIPAILSGLNPRRKFLSQFFQLRWNGHEAIGLGRIVGEVFLVIVLGDKKFARRLYPGDHGSGQLPRRVEFADGFFRLAALLIRSIEDDRAILGAYVVALAV